MKSVLSVTPLKKLFTTEYAEISENIGVEESSSVFSVNSVVNVFLVDLCVS